MTDFSVRFVNSTSSVWTLVVVAAPLNGASSLECVAFQQVRAASSGSGTVRFNDQPSVSLATYTGSGASRIYDTTLTKDVAAGSAWKVITQDGVQQFAANGSARFPGEIDVLNASGVLLPIGIGAGGGAAAFQPNVLGGTYVPFGLPLSFSAILSSDQVQPGQVMGAPPGTIAAAVLSQQVALTLSAATPTATVTATVDGAQLVITVTHP